MNFKPSGNFVLVRQCLNASEVDVNGGVDYQYGNIFVSELFAKTSNYAEILDIGDGCKLFSDSDIGGFVRCPELATGLHRVGDSDDFLVRESLLEKEFPAVIFANGDNDE